MNSKALFLAVLLSLPAAAGLRPKANDAPPAAEAPHRRYRMSDIPEGTPETKRPILRRVGEAIAVIATFGLYYILPGARIAISGRSGNSRVQIDTGR